jgi:hypothetical protein
MPYSTRVAYGNRLGPYLPHGKLLSGLERVSDWDGTEMLAGRPSDRPLIGVLTKNGSMHPI